MRNTGLVRSSQGDGTVRTSSKAKGHKRKQWTLGKPENILYTICKDMASGETRTRYMNEKMSDNSQHGCKPDFKT